MSKSPNLLVERASQKQIVIGRGGLAPCGRRILGGDGGHLCGLFGVRRRRRGLGCIFGRAKRDHAVAVIFHRLSFDGDADLIVAVKQGFR